MDITTIELTREQKDCLLKALNVLERKARAGGWWSDVLAPLAPVLVKLREAK